MIRDCELMETAAGWTCPDCDQPPMPFRARRNCRPRVMPVASAPPAPVPFPSLPLRVLRYARAVLRWFWAGRGSRPGWKIDWIYRRHCRPCPEFDAERGGCRKCGCCVSLDRRAMRNKIAMRTEHCPIGRW